MNDWISVEDRLPSREAVLVVVGTKKMRSVLFGFIGKNGKWIGCGSFSDLGKVTHWMPLPPPPKED